MHDVYITHEEDPNLPRWCIYNKRKLRVLAYLGKDKFEILDQYDMKKTLHRKHLRFVK